MSSAPVAFPLFHGDESAPPASPRQFELVPLGAREACSLNALWHSRLPRLPWSNVTRNRYSACWGAHFSGRYYGVAIWSSPVAGPHAFDLDTTLELRRLAIAPGAPKFSATWMIAACIKQIRRRFPLVARLISYQDTEVHTGTIYRAAGWVPVTMTKAGEIHWNNGSRDRTEIQTSAAKVRWERALGAVA